MVVLPNFQHKYSKKKKNKLKQTNINRNRLPTKKINQYVTRPIASDLDPKELSNQHVYIYTYIYMQGKEIYESAAQSKKCLSFEQ